MIYYINIQFSAKNYELYKEIGKCANAQEKKEAIETAYKGPDVELGR